jgi:hypothetical protein
MKKHKEIVLRESYEVKLNYRGNDGYWVQSHIEVITIEIKNGAKEKCNHKKAEKIARKMFPGCTVTTVTYM